MALTTQRSVLGLLVLSLLSTFATALQASPESPCAALCLNTSSNSSSPSNRPDEIVCDNKEYASVKGQKFMGCVNCLQNSTYTYGSQNDQAWFMYNLQYAFAHCVFGYDGTGIGPYPCMTSEACGPLKTTVSRNLANNTGNDPYAYCHYRGGSALGETFGKCLDCMKPDTKHGYLANFFVALEAGCEQRPGSQGHVSLNDTLFANRTIGIVDPNKPDKSSKPGLSTGALIAVVIVSVLLGLGLLAGCIFLHLRRRRNNRYNKSALEHDAALHMRGAATGPSSGMRNFRNSVHNIFTPGSRGINNQHYNKNNVNPSAMTWQDPGHLVELRTTASAAEEKAALAAAALAQEEQLAHGNAADALHSHPPAEAVRNFSHKQRQQQQQQQQQQQCNIDTNGMNGIVTQPERAVTSPCSPESYTTPSSATSATPFFAVGQGSSFSPVSPPPPMPSSAFAALKKQQSWDETRAQARGAVADLLRPKASKTDVKAPVASKQFNTSTFAPPPRR